MATVKEPHSSWWGYPMGPMKGRGVGIAVGWPDGTLLGDGDGRTDGGTVGIEVDGEVVGLDGLTT